MPSPVGGGGNLPGPPVKPEEESIFVFRAGKAIWAALTSVLIAGLTASRLVVTNSSGQLDTPATITTSQTVALNGVTTVVDGSFSITGSGDINKTLKFEVDAQSTGADLTVNSGAQTADRSLSVPVLTADATLMVLSETQTVSGAKTFSAILTTLENCSLAAKPGAVAWVSSGDNNTGAGAFRAFGASSQIGWQVGSNITTAHALEFTPATANGGTTFSTPVLVLLTASATFSSACPVKIGDGTGQPSLSINGAANNARSLFFQTAGANRWNFLCTSGTESGANTGSPFALSAYADNGAYIDDPINITRAAGGAFTITRPLTLSVTTGTTLTVSSTTDSTSKDTGSIVTEGGLGVEKTIYAGNAILSVGATHGIGYATGAGGTVTQITSRATGVTLNKVCGQITLVSAAGSAAWASFTVTNSAVATTDVIQVCQDSGTDRYMIHVTAVGAGSFEITFATTGGTTVEQPVFSFAVIKAVAA